MIAQQKYLQSMRRMTEIMMRSVMTTVTLQIISQRSTMRAITRLPSCCPVKRGNTATICSNQVLTTGPVDKIARMIMIN